MTGVFLVVYAALHRILRLQEGREPDPSLGILDSQTVKSASTAREDVGDDAAKLTKGRKRHLLVDTLGYPFEYRITGGNIQDYTAGADLISLGTASSARLKRILVDALYQTLAKSNTNDSLVIEVVKRPRDAKGFVLLPRRWIVERTFGWLGNYRRLARDYERLLDSSMARLTAALIHLLVRRLRPSEPHGDAQQPGIAA